MERRTGRRATRQRAQIAAALRGAGGFRTAQQLHRDLRRAGGEVGLTTVYRTLSGLVAAGEVDVLRTDQGEAIYRRCGRDDHHHHLVCRHCGQSVEIGDPQIESWTAATAQRHGFVETSHAVEVFGRCRGCAESR